MTPEHPKCAVREAPQKTSIARQRLAGHVSGATDEHGIVEEPLGMVISVRFALEL
jgi:hypothetical protein